VLTASNDVLEAVEFYWKENHSFGRFRAALKKAGVIINRDRKIIGKDATGAEQ
jgi:hypothetical protein